MEKSIFPKKFSGSIKEHHKILQKELIHFQNKNIIEIATGSGDAVKYLNNNNIYTGIDISPGLLNIAAKKFAKSGFKEAEFYIADACNIPFNDDCFDFGICNLSLNFFENIELFISELKRVLKPGAVFYCSVPIKDRLMTTTKIRGNIYHEKQLEKKFQDHNLNYSSLNYRNGTLLYFKAVNE